MSNVFFFLAGISGLLFIIGLVRPKTFGSTTTAQKILLWLGAPTGFFIILSIVFVQIEASMQELIENTPVASEDISEEIPAENEPSYQVLKQENEEPGINVVLLMDQSDQTTAEQIARTYFEQCKSTCNVEVYDNEEAFQIQNEYDKQYADYSFEESQAWEEKNLVFIADHLLGMISFDAPELWLEFPLKDSRYDELK